MLDGLQILIVEDEAFVAMDLVLAVEDHGGIVIGPFATVAEAMTLLQHGTTHGAILDANLLDRDVTPVAVHLLNRGVPFILHTGTGAPDELSALHPQLPVIMKPTPTGEIIDALARQIRLAHSGRS